MRGSVFESIPGPVSDTSRTTRPSPGSEYVRTESRPPPAIASVALRQSPITTCFIWEMSTWTGGSVSSYSSESSTPVGGTPVSSGGSPTARAPAGSKRARTSPGGSTPGVDGQLRGAVRHPPDHVEVRGGLGVPPGVHRKKLDGALDRGEDVVELVRDPAGEQPDRGERLALGEAGLHFSSLGDVPGHAEDAPVPFRTFRERGRRRLHVHEAPVGAPHPVREGRARRLPVGRAADLRHDVPGVVWVEESLDGEPLISSGRTPSIGRDAGLA